MKVGIAGTGKIIPEAIEAMQTVGMDVVSIWGRHPEKARPLAARFAIGQVCQTFEELVRSGVDCVYIALANAVHGTYARQALEAGVDVLLEKPFCSHAAEARALTDLASQKGLFLLETISNIHLPVWQAVREHLPEIGPLKLFQADFSQYSSKYDLYRAGTVTSAFDPALEGGVLRDLNVYNLHLAVSLLGKPESVSYQCNRGWNGIDTSGTVVLSYAGSLAICTAAKDSPGHAGVTIQGENGFLHVDGMPNLLPSLTISLRGQAPVTLTSNRYANRLCHQFAALRDLLESQDHKKAEELTKQTLTVMEILDACQR